MIRLSVKGPNFAPINAMIDRIARPDLRPLAAALSAVMIEDNRRGLLAGTNADDSRAADLAPYTLKHRDGDGPPRIPQGDGAAFIDDYAVEEQETADRTLLIGGWRNTPHVHFHATGTRYMPARDPVGIRAWGQERIAEETNRFAHAMIGGQP